MLAGDAVKTVAPTSVVGGEFVRFRLLSRRLPSASSAVSVSLAAMSQYFAQVLFLLTGLPLVAMQIPQPGLRVGLALFAAAMLALVLGVAFLGWSRDGLRRLGALAARIPGARAWWERRPASWRAFPLQANAYLRERPGHFALSAAASFLGWQMGVVETFLILKFLGTPVGWTVALAIEVLSVGIEGALFFVPAKMGTQEGGKVLIFLALGLDPAKGLALGFVRRLRELAWAAVGLAIFGWHQRGSAVEAVGRGSGQPASPASPLRASASASASASESRVG